MNEIYDADDKFNFDELSFLKPIAVAGGNYFIRIRKNNSPLYIQPPQCTTKQGILKVNKKHFTDLMFTNENEDFIRWMENLESRCQNTIFTNRSTWFDSELDLHNIENYFTSPLKVYKSGKFYITRTNISLISGEPSLKIYDENENQLEMESINDKTNVITVLEIQGIKCSARSFQIEIELKQMMTIKPSDIFEKCVLKTNVNKGATIEKIEPATPLEIIDAVNLNSVTNINEVDITNPTNYEISVGELLQDTSYTKQNEKTNNEDINFDSNIQRSKIEELEEIEFDLEELPTTETVQLKERNDVYYEMYREAKRKARIARDLALSSYLEAKRIKNTYKLHEIKDSDESDLESDEGGQDLEQS